MWPHLNEWGQNIAKAAKSNSKLRSCEKRTLGDPGLGHSGPSQQDTGMGIQAANGWYTQDLIYSIKHLIILQIHPLAFSSRHLIIDSDKCLWVQQTVLLLVSERRQIVCRSRDANAVCQTIRVVGLSLRVYNWDQDCCYKNRTRRIGLLSQPTNVRAKSHHQSLSCQGEMTLKCNSSSRAVRDTRDIVARIPAIIYLKYTVWPFVAFLQTQPRQSWIREHQRGGYRLLVCCCIHNTTAHHHAATPASGSTGEYYYILPFRILIQITP